jgi:hypothetical protein
MDMTAARISAPQPIGAPVLRGVNHKGVNAAASGFHDVAATAPNGTTR